MEEISFDHKYRTKYQNYDADESFSLTLCHCGDLFCNINIARNIEVMNADESFSQTSR